MIDRTEGRGLTMWRRLTPPTWRPVFSRRVALFIAAGLTTACATSSPTPRLEAEIADLLGFPQGATATRGTRGWTIERRLYALGQNERVRLSHQDSAALDAALADPALYATPEPLSGELCIDTAVVTLDVVGDGPPRRLKLECETSPGLEAVLRIMFAWPVAGGEASPRH